MKHAWLVLTAAALLLAAGTATASPIVYEAQLLRGVPYAGVNTQAPNNQANPLGANYFSYYATAGSSVTVFGDRLIGSYDLGFWVFRGLYNDTSDFGPSFPGAQAGNFMALGDNQDPPNIAGPFGDPNVTFTAPTTGLYTIAVTNGLSSAGPPNPFQLQANFSPTPPAIPEPGSMALLGMALLGAAAYSGWHRKRVAGSMKPGRVVPEVAVRLFPGESACCCFSAR